MADQFSQHPGRQMTRVGPSPVTQTDQKAAVSGVVLSVLAMIGGIVGIVIVFNAIDRFGGEQTQITNDWDAYTECIYNAQTPEEKSACS
ncbi:hypothetical protein [Rhodococcus spongiicola]|uniref:Uncharacterized protein n=1 Tax=Rhodococcus spongiicola TaxID=2487352 RepID=A0A3S3CUW9_9NOCA|nr:hypothetical protein [Rhodococcus spongiicola]RVW06195.1 hypothetical protein EF834_01700 [Rhodococcus spongiicola]